MPHDHDHATRGGGPLPGWREALREMSYCAQCANDIYGGSVAHRMPPEANPHQRPSRRRLGCFDLGWMYANGRGVEQDEAKAVELYRAAAEQGWAPAQFNLGLMYANGQGVEQDEAKAVELYRAAAEQGD